jgi:hypothetical protein
MLQQNSVLSNKIKIGFEYDKGDFANHFGFYTNYSRFILKALKKSSFQEYLYFMLLTENIEEKIINTVDIKVFPAPRKNGFNVVGKCDTFRGRIRIYPKTFNFCYAFKKKFGKNYLFAFVGNRARAALIHELLHLKYVSDEEKVRELTKIYFSAYMKKQILKNSNLVSLHDLIFNSKKKRLFSSIQFRNRRQ